MACMRLWTRRVRLARLYPVKSKPRLRLRYSRSASNSRARSIRNACRVLGVWGAAEHGSGYTLIVLPEIAVGQALRTRGPRHSGHVHQAMADPSPSFIRASRITRARPMAVLVRSVDGADTSLQEQAAPGGTNVDATAMERLRVNGVGGSQPSLP